MTCLYVAVIVFSLLTIFLSYEEYRKNERMRRLFIATTVLEALVAVLTLIILMLHLQS